MYDSASSAPSLDRVDQQLPMLIDSRGNSSTTIGHTMAIDGTNTRSHNRAGVPGETLTQFPETAAPIVSLGSAPSRQRLERLNSIRKVLSFTEFWDSLPAASKAFLIISIVDAAVIIAFSIEQLVAVSLEQPGVSRADTTPDKLGNRTHRAVVRAANAL